MRRKKRAPFVAFALALGAAAIAVAAPKHEPIQCPATASISLTATTKAEGFAPAKLTTDARLKEARIELSELRCVYDATVSGKPVLLTRAIPGDQVCKVGVDG